MAKRRARSQTERRERRRQARQEREERKKRAYKVLIGALVIVIILIGASVGAYYYILKDVKEKQPRPEIEVVDAVGTKGDPSVDAVTSIKISIKNKGGGSFDLKDLSVYWRGPSTDTKILFNDGSYADATKDSFGTGGFGSATDGWDPSAGEVHVKGGTLAWVVVNLTVSGGIGDPLGPKASFTVTFSVQDGDHVKDEVADFSVPSDISAGTFVVMDKK
jgi:hypothetical protein